MTGHCTSDCASTSRTITAGGFDWAECSEEEREQISRHARFCTSCRSRLLQQDPLWSFRLWADVGDDSHEPSVDASEIEQMQQRVWGSIRSRSLEIDVADAKVRKGSARWQQMKSLLAAAGLLAAIGVAAQFGAPDRATELQIAARSELAAHLDALPVVDSADWPSVASPVPGRDAEGTGPAVSVSQVLAQVSDADADVVWVVNASLEL